ncbi:hypothetical protein ACHAW6_015958 [Cyclotella cf. meneghiniana]
MSCPKICTSRLRLGRKLTRGHALTSFGVLCSPEHDMMHDMMHAGHAISR